MDEFKKRLMLDPKLAAGGDDNVGYRSGCNCCGIEHHSRYAGRYRRLYRRRARRMLRKEIE